MDHFNRAPKRSAEFFRPPNAMRSKVGAGGLSEETLNKAQDVIAASAVDFHYQAQEYFGQLQKAIDQVRGATLSQGNNEQLIGFLIFPVLQLKGNGGMYNYNLITLISGQLIEFLEVIDTPDQEALEIVTAFLTTMRLVIQNHLNGDGGAQGKQLLQALQQACLRYFEKKPA